MIRKFTLILSSILSLSHASCVGDIVYSQVPDVQKQMPIKITYEIYSGRNSPYFEIAAPEEVHEIDRRLIDLPLSSRQEAPAEWSGSYVFELTGEQNQAKQLVTVSKTNIQIQQKDSSKFFEDSKSLRKYLDGLRIKHGLKPGD